MALKEHAVPASKVAQFVTSAINACPLTQKEISERIGFNKPHVITMIKQGHTRMPLERIPAFAEAVECDVAKLLRLAIEEYYAKGAERLLQAFSTGGVSENEKALLSAVRDAAGGADPAFDDKTLKRIAKLVKDSLS